MDQKAIEADVKNYKVREGPLYKRSKFLKEWRERWVVLTTNYLYTFTSKNLDQVTDVVDLKQIKSYKSYLRKDQEMIPPGFKIRTGDDMFYLCAKNCGQKWSWIVTLERLMDYKYVGTSNYNNADWIRTRGFQSQLQFEGAKVEKQKAVQETKTEGQAKKNENVQIQKLMKQIQQQKEELEKKKLELDMKEASLQQKESDLAKELKKIEEQRKQLQHLHKQAKQTKPKEEPKTKQEPKPKQEPKKQAPKQPESPTKIESTNQPSVSAIRNMFENRKSEAPNPAPKPVTKVEQKQVNKKDDISTYRSRIVNFLFEQFRKQAPYSNVLKYVTQFLVNVGADQKCGYSPFVVIQGKTNSNNKHFAEVFIQLLGVFDDYEKCQNLMNFYQICIFQMPGLFNEAQTAKSQLKLKQLFNKVQDEDKLALVLKNMVIMNKIKKFQKNDVQAKLEKILKESKNEAAKNWAMKLKQDLDK